MIAQKRYEEFFKTIVSGKERINSFFDNIMVMDKDEAVKANRISLLKKLDYLFNEVAQITKIEE